VLLVLLVSMVPVVQPEQMVLQVLRELQD